jgi:Cdc6-like AAA superfamily ATPase
MRKALERLDREFAFQTSGRFDLLAAGHIPYQELGAPDADGRLRRGIERAEGVVTVIGRMGSGKSSLIAAVTDSLDEGFVPVRVSVTGVEAGKPAAFARHAIAEIRDLPMVQLAAHEKRALDRATADRRRQGSTRELRAGFEVAVGKILTAEIAGDIKRSASEELERRTDPSEALRGMQRLFDTFWKVKRCPVMIVEDTDHWGGSPNLANAFFDQTARAFATMDAVMVVATQSDYTGLDGYVRIRDKLTAEVRLPRLQNAKKGLTTLLEARIASAGVEADLTDVLEPDALTLLARSYLESVTGAQAGDLRRTLAVMRASIEIALSEPTARLVTAGHVQEAIAKTPLPPSSAL